MFYLFALISVLILLLIFDRHAFRDKRYLKTASQFRGRFVVPIFGNILVNLFKKHEDLLESVSTTFETFGSSVYFWIFNKLVILTQNPKYFEAILTNQKQLAKNNFYGYLHEWLGEGILVASGKKWHSRRKIITPAFHFQILQEFVEVFNVKNEILIEKLKKVKDEEPFDVYNIITAMSLDIISQTAMNVDLHAQRRESKYTKAVKDISYIIAERLMRFWKRSDFLFSFTKDKKRYDECLEIIHTFTREIIEKRRAALLNGGGENFGTKKKMALLDILLKSTIEGKPLSNADIAEEVDTFMFEGHDTITASTCFSLYLFSQNLEAQEKVFNEVTEILGDDLSISPNYNQLMEMKYLECCIKESLRLFPPVPIIGRNLEEDLKLPDGKIIAAGCNFNLSIYHLNRDPKYFENPQEFIPERFSEAKVKSKNPFLYVPFSAGPRNCIGQKFAMLELKSTLCNLIRNFQILPGKVPLQLSVQLTLKSLSGVHVGFRQRK